jgi:spermidine synthase
MPVPAQCAAVLVWRIKPEYLMSRYLLTCLCFVFSGVAALIYQVVWTRQFALVFGTSELAVATVLATYMAGLALGARLVERWLPRIARPVRWYALFEAGIAASALIWVPLCLWLAEKLLVLTLGGRADPPSAMHSSLTVFYVCAAFVTLLVPTVLMGATLPLLVRDGVHSDAQIGRRVGFLYVCNTAGAVVGALLTALVLLPQMGMRATVWCAAFVNVMVALVAWRLIKSEPVAAPATMQATTPVAASSAAAESEPVLSHVKWILPLMLLSGAVSFVHEVLWTRLLAHVLGGSIIAFGVMVASFLIGIALGGGIGAWWAKRSMLAARAWVIAQWLIAVMAMLAWVVLPHAPLQTSLWVRVGFGLCVLLPLTTAIGATYPLAVRMLAAHADDAAAASARVYSWNTVGAVLGSLLSGFWLIPWLRYEGSVRVIVWFSALLALAAAWRWMKAERGWWLSSAAIALLVLMFQPSAPEAVMRLSPLRPPTGEMVYYGVGRGADVVVFRKENTFDLRTNGLPEAGIDVIGAVPSLNVEAWMSPLAVLSRPNTQSMLVVGFGGGNAVEAVPPTVKSIDVIELEPNVIAANQTVAAERARDPLYDSRVNLIINDARGSLQLTNKRYDAVVSQPSHPWTAGASHLYTREFMHQVHEHLNEGGVFVQWLATDFLDESLLRSLLATLNSEFSQVRLYRPSSTTLLFMASDAPIEPERQWQQTQTVIDHSINHYERLGINVVEDLLGALALDESGVKTLAANRPLITDDDNRLATSGVFDFNRAMTGGQAGDLLLPFDPLTRADNNLLVDLHEHVHIDYLSGRLAMWARTDHTANTRLQRLYAMLGDSEPAAVLRVLAAQRDDKATTTEADPTVREGLSRWPNSQTLNYAMIELAINDLAAGTAKPEVKMAYQHLTGEPLMVANAMLMALKENWPALKDMDAQLAAVPWTAPWYKHAAQLRVEWRARVGNRDLRLRFGPEAIAIADRVLLSQSEADWYALRALNAINADQPQSMLESIAGFAQVVVSRQKVLNDLDRARMRPRAQQLQQLLASLQGLTALSAARLDEVNATFAKAMAVLN